MKILIDGMHCQACVNRVRKAIEKVEGTQVQQVDVGSAVISVESAREAAVLEAVRKAGYEPRVASE
jgi:copper chaperone